MAHTPGKWFYNPNDLRNSFGKPQKTIRTKTATGQTDIVANVFGKSIEESESNATLFIAAPDLLEALKELLYDYTTKDFDVCGLDEKLIDKCYLAIGKAKATA